VKGFSFKPKYALSSVYIAGRCRRVRWF